MVAALYIRVSTHDQEELSPDSQKALLIQYAKDHEYQVDPDHIYIDGGISGRKAEKRPEFMRLIAAAKQKPTPFDCILVWKFSRFARNQEESIVYKSMLAKQCGVDVISISEPIIDGPFGSLIERIIEWMDEYYSIRLSGEVMRGMTEKAKRGGYQAQPPIGYKMVDKVPVIDPGEAEIVRKMFRLSLDGYDVSSIARILNDEGLLTKHGNSWESRNVKYLLQNPFYTGKIRWNRAQHSSHLQNPTEEIIVSQGIHEPIISQEDWDEVQRRVDARCIPYKSRGSSKCGSVFSGVLKCAVCGGSMGYNGAPGNKYFNCIKYSKGVHRGSQLITRKQLLESLIPLMLADADGKRPIIYRQRPAEPTGVDYASIDKKLTRLSDREKRCRVAYQEGIDTLEEYKANRAKIAEERARLEAELENAKSAPVDLVAFRQKLRSVIDLIQDENVDVEIRNNALKSVAEKIVWNKESRSLDIFYLL